jgi:CRP-like cAMP-binding protein
MEAPMFHQLIYIFKDLSMMQDEYILRENDQISSMIVVMSGKLEFTIDVDGFEFVICYGTSGTVINIRNMFKNTKMFFNVKCAETSSMKLISINDIEALTVKNEEFSEKILKFIEDT